LKEKTGGRTVNFASMKAFYREVARGNLWKKRSDSEEFRRGNFTELFEWISKVSRNGKSAAPIPRHFFRSFPHRAAAMTPKTDIDFTVPRLFF
jgi:hypothetical protein